MAFFLAKKQKNGFIRDCSRQKPPKSIGNYLNDVVYARKQGIISYGHYLIPYNFCSSCFLFYVANVNPANDAIPKLPFEQL